MLRGRPAQFPGGCAAGDRERRQRGGWAEFVQTDAVEIGRRQFAWGSNCSRRKSASAASTHLDRGAGRRWRPGRRPVRPYSRTTTNVAGAAVLVGVDARARGRRCRPARALRPAHGLALESIPRQLGDHHGGLARQQRGGSLLVAPCAGLPGTRRTPKPRRRRFGSPAAGRPAASRSTRMEPGHERCRALSGTVDAIGMSQVGRDWIEWRPVAAWRYCARCSARRALAWPVSPVLAGRAVALLGQAPAGEPARRPTFAARRGRARRAVGQRRGDVRRGPAAPRLEGAATDQLQSCRAMPAAAPRRSCSPNCATSRGRSVRSMRRATRWCRRRGWFGAGAC
jgi:hypothetical protein